jgi:cytochrome P450
MTSTSPLTDQLLAEPYDYYAELREKTPVSRVRLPNGLEAWQITRYQDAVAVLSDPRYSTSAERLQRAGALDFGPSMLTSDPPVHTRLRSLVSKAFTPRRIDGLRPRVQEIVHQLLDDAASHPEVDLIESFAVPLPVAVICQLLGVPVEDSRDLLKWTRIMGTTPTNNEGPRSRRHAAGELQQYFGRLVNQKREMLRSQLGEEEQPDLLSALIAARYEGGHLDDDDLIGMLNLLLFAGHETTTALIGNGLLALFHHPQQMQLMRERPELLPTAIEEFLRFEAPVQRGTYRVALEDVVVSGITIPAGDIVVVAIGSAQRDPRQFAFADRLDIERRNGQNLAFGHGIHYCLGAPLARMEGQMAIGTLLARFPRLQLCCDPDDVRRASPGIFVRRVAQLPVRLT